MTREWFFQVMGQELGPLSVGELKAKVANGQIQPDSLVRKGTEGRWIFAGKVKGLFAVPEEPPPAPPPAAKPKSSAILPTVSGQTAKVKLGSSAELATKSGATPPPPSSATIAIATMKLDEGEPEVHSPSIEFYDFVGFREAISPMLYDAVKRYSSERGITLTQLNRRALAEFIRRPELASDLMITAISIIPQAVNDKSNKDGSQPLTDKERIERSTFRFTIFNSGHDSIHIEEGAFLPESIEVRRYDTVAEGQPPAVDHTGHVPVRLEEPQQGKAIRMNLDTTLPPQIATEVTVWFHAATKPSFMKIKGQLLLGHGGGLAMSEYFTVVLHGDSPAPPI